MTTKAPTPMPEGMNRDNRPKAPAAPPSKSDIWKEQERKDLIDENLALHEELFKAREEIKKLQGIVQRLGNRLAKEKKS